MKRFGRPITCSFNSKDENEIAAIDPIFNRSPKGENYLALGGGYIYTTKLNSVTHFPNHDKWYEKDSKYWSLFAKGPLQNGECAWVEAPYIYYHKGFYYLFVNWGHFAETSTLHTTSELVTQIIL